jgi:hypothetical protein
MNCKTKGDEVASLRLYSSRLAHYSHNLSESCPSKSFNLGLRMTFNFFVTTRQKSGCLIVNDYNSSTVKETVSIIPEMTNVGISARLD